ncbi:MAG: SDR family NAD(P)-dependent oxidoreductase [Bacteroidia bacterium]|nr:SDR family NAD(P)-dependent oxidoreductase [Bacteroidia bacterium]
MNYKLSQKFPEKRAFITGAASGLGREFALELAKDGWTVGIADLNEANMAKVAREVSDLGGKAFTYRLDVVDRELYHEIAYDFIKDAGGIDLLINNAGVGDGAAFLQYDLKHWDWMIGINQMGVVHGCFFFAPKMIDQGGGHIINIASAASFSNAPYMSAYNVTKAAVRSLSETLYHEFKQHKVGVSAVMPTFFPTNIMQSARGPKSNHIFAKKMMERSKVTANEVASEVLTKAGKGKMEIILPKEARRNFFIKKFFPGLFENQLDKMVEFQQKIDKSMAEKK